VQEISNNYNLTNVRGKVDSVCSQNSLQHEQKHISYEMGRHTARTEDMINEYKILVRDSEGKRPLWRPRHRWSDYY